MKPGYKMGLWLLPHVHVILSIHPSAHRPSTKTPAIPFTPSAFPLFRRQPPPPLTRPTHSLVSLILLPHTSPSPSPSTPPSFPRRGSTRREEVPSLPRYSPSPSSLSPPWPSSSELQRSSEVHAPLSPFSLFPSPLFRPMSPLQPVPPEST